mmetsp:Transcript_7267/g.15211  ORF Transcript_7267/g.15211 Transcript_7267/m.15211 type:complete len:215 (-) Transcript_7267:662-1306(-)
MASGSARTVGLESRPPPLLRLPRIQMELRSCRRLTRPRMAQSFPWFLLLQTLMVRRPSATAPLEEKRNGGALRRKRSSKLSWPSIALAATGRPLLRSSRLVVRRQAWSNIGKFSLGAGSVTHLTKVVWRMACTPPHRLSSRPRRMSMHSSRNTWMRRSRTSMRNPSTRSSRPSTQSSSQSTRSSSQSMPRSSPNTPRSSQSTPRSNKNTQNSSN